MFVFAAGCISIFANADTILGDVFGGDIPHEPLALHQVAARAIVVYVLGVAIVRLGKSRVLSRTTPVDVLLGFILGSLLSRGVTGHASISGTTIASLAMVALHWVITALACRSHWLGNLLKGHSRLIVKDGHALEGAMRQSHISRHDLLEQLRLHGVENVAAVQAAYKERNGEISVIPGPTTPHVIEVSVQDGVQTVRIALG
jgi:uncharacterized membrane protein YcaP (DUF421 family)